VEAEPLEIALDTGFLSAQNEDTMYLSVLDRKIALNLWWWDS